jgi:hypothetical protein
MAGNIIQPFNGGKPIRANVSLAIPKAPNTPDKITFTTETVMSHLFELLSEGDRNRFRTIVDYSFLNDIEPEAAIFPLVRNIAFLQESIKKRYGLEEIQVQNYMEICGLPLKLSGQRSVILTLDQPITYGERTFRALKFKGQVFSHFFNVDIYPPLMLLYMGFGFAPPLKHFDREGNPTNLSPFDLGAARPYGGMLQSRVENEYQMTYEMLCAGQPVNLSIAKGSFGGDYYQPNDVIKENIGSVVLAIEDHADRRMWENIFEARDREDLPDYLRNMFICFGQAARKAHDNDFFPGMLHAENTRFSEEGEISIHDLDTALFKPGTTPIQNAFYRFQDIFLALPLLISLSGNPEEAEKHAEYEVAEYGPSGIVTRLLAIAELSRIIQGAIEEKPSDLFLLGYFGKTIDLNYEKTRHWFINLHDPASVEKIKESTIIRELADLAQGK